MSMTIRKYPEPVLQKKARDVGSIGREEKSFLSDMKRHMHASGGIGLAAPQVGVSRRMIVVNNGEEDIAMVNPRIISKRGRSVMEEGCLSVPQKAVRVKRAGSVIVSYTDEEGKRAQREFKGLAAHVVQHEIDHLNGKLILDHISWYRKIFTKKGKGKCQT